MLILGCLKRRQVRRVWNFASEQEFKGLFPACETGAMPAFGNLYGMDVYADVALAKDKAIAFNAGSPRAD